MTEYCNDRPGLIAALTNLSDHFRPAFDKVSKIYHDAPVFELKLGKFDPQMEMVKFAPTGQIVSHCGRNLASCAWVDVVGFDPHELLYKNFDGAHENRPSVMDIACGRWFAKEGISFDSSLVRRD